MLSSSGVITGSDHGAKHPPCFTVCRVRVISGIHHAEHTAGQVIEQQRVLLSTSIQEQRKAEKALYDSILAQAAADAKAKVKVLSCSASCLSALIQHAPASVVCCSPHVPEHYKLRSNAAHYAAVADYINLSLLGDFISEMQIVVMILLLDVFSSTQQLLRSFTACCSFLHMRRCMRKTAAS